MKQNRIIGKCIDTIGKFFDSCGKLFVMRGRWLAVSSILLVAIIMGAGGYYISQYKLNNTESPKVVQAVQIKAQVRSQVNNKAVVIKLNDNTQAISDEEWVVYNKMHKMINSKIVAQDGKIWGEVVITPNNCKQLISEITKSGYPDKTVLLQFLTHWENKNFINGVNEHNYLWDGLGGTIGKAKSLRN